MVSANNKAPAPLNRAENANILSSARNSSRSDRTRDRDIIICCRVCSEATSADYTVSGKCPIHIPRCNYESGRNGTGSLSNGRRNVSCSPSRKIGTAGGYCSCPFARQIYILRGCYVDGNTQPQHQR